MATFIRVVLFPICSVHQTCLMAPQGQTQADPLGKQGDESCLQARPYGSSSLKSASLLKTNLILTLLKIIVQQQYLLQKY